MRYRTGMGERSEEGNEREERGLRERERREMRYRTGMGERSEEGNEREERVETDERDEINDRDKRKRGRGMEVRQVERAV